MKLSRLHNGHLSVAILAMLLCGCGSGLYPVEGKVVWKDGSPATELAGSIVTFEGPETSSIGSIQPDATFQLTTHNPNDGAPPGEYEVVVIEVGRKALPGGDGTMMAPGIIDSKFSQLGASGLKATVVGGENKITLTVERAPRE